MSDDAAKDPVTDAIEQARQGGLELTEEQINYLRNIRDEQGPGVRFVISTESGGLGVSVLDANHEQHQAEYASHRANRPDWVRQMERAAVAIAFPDWGWQEDDDAEVVVFGESNKDGFLGTGVAVTVARPRTDSEMIDTFTGEEAAEFMHKLLGGTGWPGVNARG